LEVPVQHDGTTLPTWQDTIPRPAKPMGYTPAEVARITGISRNTVYQWLKADELRSRRIRGVHYIPAAEVRALLDLDGEAIT
jgi:excisionase family DNA binding protein